MKRGLRKKVLLATVVMMMLQPFVTVSVYADEGEGDQGSNPPAPPVVDPVVEVEVTAKDGLLDYTVVNGEKFEGYDLENPVNEEWYQVVGKYDHKEGVEESDDLLVGEEHELSPEETGGYYVIVTLMGDGLDPVEGSPEIPYPVIFPEIDDSQFQDTLRAGESLRYVDEAGVVEELSVAIDGSEVEVVPVGEGAWIISGELTESKKYKLYVEAESEDGFVTSYEGEVQVGTGVVSNADLKVTYEGEVVDYVEAGSGVLEVKFEAYDDYMNKIEASSLEKVDVRLNGVLLGGTDYKGNDKYLVRRIGTIPEVENYNSIVTVDVFDEDCDGVLTVGGINMQNYCFSKSHSFVAYDTEVEKVTDLVYPIRTRVGVIVVTGVKKAGYGVKLNSTSSAYAVKPDELTTFEAEVPLAEGLNEVKLYAVKEVSPELVFYSDPASVTIERDTKVSAPVWGAPAITLDGDNQATLHWTDPVYLTDTDGDFSHVNIYRSTVPNFVPSEYNLVVQTHNPSWTDTALATGQKYYYVVEAVDSLGNTATADGVMATGDILGESATTETESWDVSDFGGKGEYNDGEGTYEEESGTEDEVTGEELGEDGQDEEVSGSSLWSRVKEGTSSIFKKLAGNIFVQICLGGILIFFALMMIISFLVWAKERLVDTSMISSSDSKKRSKE